MPEPKKFPSWRQAAEEFLSKFKYGDLVGHEWLEQRFGMVSVGETQKMTAQQFRERQFEWLANVDAFKAELLIEHQVCLQTVRGQGYRWVEPKDQTDVAIREFESGARKIFRTAGDKLRKLRHLELTDEGRRANSDAVAKVAALSGMASKALR